MRHFERIEMRLVCRRSTMSRGGLPKPTAGMVMLGITVVTVAPPRSSA
jgi:hypothetical protein